MRILPKTMQEAQKLVYEILNQGDSRYNDPENESILSSLILNQAISLEEREIPNIEKPKEMLNYDKVQIIEKYIAKELLKKEGFSDSKISFERRFRGSRPDLIAESENKIILVECCSCRVSKIIDYLSENNTEVWVFTIGSYPWETLILYEKIKWFVFKRGKNWQQAEKLKEKHKQDMKEAGSPLDNL